MRILHAIWSLELGGAESLLVDLLARQCREATVGLLVGNACIDERVLAGLDPAVRVIRVGRPPGSRNPWFVYRLRRAVKAFRPDVVHCHNPSLRAVLPADGFRCLLTVHDTGIELPPAVARYDRVVAISRSVQADITKRTGLKSRVIYNGIDFGALRPRSWGGGATSPRLVQVSRLVAAKKGQDLLLQALAELRVDFPGLQVDFIGTGPDAGSLAAQADALGVADRCRFLGALDRAAVYRRLPDYDLLVQPSRFEGFGLTVVEGVAAGLPVVAADLEGPREILGPLPTRFLFKAEDAADCARNIAATVGAMDEPGFGERMESNREVLRGRFDIGQVAGNYLAAYAELLGDGRRLA